MSLLNPDQTPYDICFCLFGFPFCIHPGFWVGTSIFAWLFANGADDSEGGPVVVFLVAFVCLAGSVLLHELGHVLAGRWFGADGEVVLTVVGGFAGVGIESHRRLHRILVYLAGPVANLLIFAVALAIWWNLRPSIEEIIQFRMSNPTGPLPEPTLGSALIQNTALMLFSINAALGVTNLLPIPPLDGGKIMVELMQWHRFGDRPPWEQDADWWKRR